MSLSQKVSVEAYALMKQKLKELSLPNKTVDALKNKTEWTSERSHGNYDDCFSDGQEQAEASIAESVREIIEAVELIEKNQ